MTTLTGLTVQTPSGAVYVPRSGLAIEHAIVRALILEMVKAGWAPREVWCGGEPIAEAATSRGLGEAETLEHVFSVDDAIIVFGKGKREMNVLLIGGNGQDMISDYHIARDRNDTLGAEFAEVCERVSDACQLDQASDERARGAQPIVVSIIVPVKS